MATGDYALDAGQKVCYFDIGLYISLGENIYIMALQQAKNCDTTAFQTLKRYRSNIVCLLI